MRLHVLAMAASLLLVNACGDDITAGGASVAGTWSYSAPSLTASGNAVVCEITPTTLTLTEPSIGVVSGTFGATNIVCPAGTGADTTDVPAGLTVSGTRAVNVVLFTIDGSYWSHTATRSGNELSGTVTLNTSVAGATGSLTGSWSATKQ